MVKIKTYQDLLAVRDNEEGKKQFIQTAIAEHQSSPEYKLAETAVEYSKGKNVTITNLKKLIQKVTGEIVKDDHSANYKCARNFLNMFVTQEASYEVGNGVSFGDKETKEKLGKNFKGKFYRAVKDALVQKASYGFFNNDHVEFYNFLNFVPLLDERNGKLMSGISFWQLGNKPMRITLFEIDGFTKYTVKDGILTETQAKKSYKNQTQETEAGGIEAIEESNYTDDEENLIFPVIPLYGNMRQTSELDGKQEEIDCYDLIKSGFANSIDDASLIYWTLKNAGGMDDIDLVKFKRRIHNLGVANLPNADDGAEAEAHTADVPSQGVETCLTRLESDIYKDFMALDVDKIAAGNVTATQIKAAYELLNEKTDELEMCLCDFFDGIFAVAGIVDEPKFTRSKILNVSEEIQNAILAAPFVGDEETIKIICALLGISSERAEDLIKEKIANELDRFTTNGGVNDGQGTQTD